MEITWFGHCSFLLKGANLSVFTDPFDDSLGYKPGKVQADVVTMSNQGPHHGRPDMVTSFRKGFSGPGEYEIGDVFIFGIRTFRDAAQGAERGRNTVYRILMDGLVLCHLGAIGHVPTAEQVSAIGDVDVLFVPVGGAPSLGPAKAAEVVSLLEPKIIIPMHYRLPTLSSMALALEPVDAFLKEQGVTGVDPVPRLSVTAASIQAGPQVITLECRQQR